jgi:hypothetical protein
MGQIRPAAPYGWPAQGRGSALETRNGTTSLPALQSRTTPWVLYERDRYMQAKEHQGRRPLVLPLDIIDNAATIRPLPTQTKTLNHGAISFFIALVEVVQ